MKPSFCGIVSKPHGDRRMCFLRGFGRSDQSGEKRTLVSECSETLVERGFSSSACSHVENLQTRVAACAARNSPLGSQGPSLYQCSNFTIVAEAAGRVTENAPSLLA